MERGATLLLDTRGEGQGVYRLKWHVYGNDCGCGSGCSYYHTYCLGSDEVSQNRYVGRKGEFKDGDHKRRRESKRDEVKERGTEGVR